MTSTILPTRNPAWGFYGTMESLGFDAERAWQTASQLIATATGATDPNAYGPEAVRDWLDSKDGRHFADMVHDQHQAYRDRPGDPLARAIEHAVRTYQSWTISAQTARTHGIPAGLPYLTGWVQYHAIQAEMHDEVEHP